MLIQNIWIDKKKYSITCIKIVKSNKSRVMQTYYGKLNNKGREKNLVTIEYHKPVF